MKVYYQILGVSPLALPDDIKRAFHKLAHLHHPDKGGDAETFKAISEAYAVLSNPEKRQQYDLELKRYAEHVAQQQQMQYSVFVYYTGGNGWTTRGW
jgi:curved DNA-binding protein CbpA